MYWEQLTSNLLTEEGQLPSFSDYPNKIYAPVETTAGGFLGMGKENRFWSEIVKLREFTDSGSNSFSNDYRGSTGWEYERMMIYVYNKFFYSPINTSRNYTQVTSAHSYKLEPKDVGSAWEDEVIIDGKKVGALRYASDKEKMARNKAIEEGKFFTGFICHFHSHPRMKRDATSKAYYHFFSPQDIYSMISSRVPMMGLVTDRLWVIGKTSEFVQMTKSDAIMLNLGQDLQIVTQAEVDGKEAMDAAAAEFMQKYALAGYVAEFGKTLYRLGFN